MLAARLGLGAATKEPVHTKATALGNHNCPESPCSRVKPPPLVWEIGLNLQKARGGPGAAACVTGTT